MLYRNINIDDANAFFISLVATNKWGFPELEHYLYDIATDMELQGFRIIFLSAKDIEDFYVRYHPNFIEGTVDIYEMTLFFIEMHEGSSFFLDEVPLISNHPGEFHLDLSFK